MLSGEDFGYLKDEEQNKVAIIAKKAFLIGAVLFSISCFIYITINAYYFVYNAKDGDIAIITSPPEPIKVVEQGDGMAIKDIDKTIYDNIVGNSNLIKENLDKVRVIEQVKTPLATKSDLNKAKVDENRVADRSKISNSAIVVNNPNTEANIHNQGEIIVYEPNKPENNSSGSSVGDMSLISNNKTEPKTKNVGTKAVAKNVGTKAVAKVQIAALSSRNSAIEYWSKLKKSYPKLFSNLDYFISEANLGAKGKFYRLQIGNFRSQIEAENFCRQLILQLREGKANCIIVE